MVEYVEIEKNGMDGVEPVKIWEEYSKLTIALNFINK